VWADFVHPVDELLLPVEGEIELTVQGRTWRPALGEEVFIPAGALHTVRNVGDTTSRWWYGYRTRPPAEARGSGRTRCDPPGGCLPGFAPATRSGTPATTVEPTRPSREAAVPIDIPVEIPLELPGEKPGGSPRRTAAGTARREPAGGAGRMNWPARPSNGNSGRSP
jgi:hypothetical protein